MKYPNRETRRTSHLYLISLFILIILFSYIFLVGLFYVLNDLFNYFMSH